MKQTSIFKNIAITALLVAAGNAVAAGPTATLQVKGTITPAACTPTIANGGIVDMGATSSSQITGDSLLLEQKYISIDIACSAPTKLTFNITDNRADSVVPGLSEFSARSILGLGKTSDNKPIGSYAIGLQDAVIDGESGDTLGSVDQGATWKKVPNTDVFWINNNSGTADYVTFAAAGSTTPIAFEHVTASLRISRTALSGEMKNITEVENLDGNATLNFDYL